MSGSEGVSVPVAMSANSSITLDREFFTSFLEVSTKLSHQGLLSGHI